jgi:DNA-directed RNA polymerase sigma subunit (sigma70/sigma32)
MSEIPKHEGTMTESQLMADQIMAELMKELPPDEMLTEPLSPKERSAFSDQKIKLLDLVNNILVIEKGFAAEHTLEEISSVTGISKERVRQVEQGSIHSLHRNPVVQEDMKNLKEEYRGHLRKKNRTGEVHYMPDASGHDPKDRKKGTY